MVIWNSLCVKILMKMIIKWAFLPVIPLQMPLTSSNRLNYDIHILFMNDPLYACVACFFYFFFETFWVLEPEERDEVNGCLYRSVFQTSTSTKFIFCNSNFLIHFTLAALGLYNALYTIYNSIYLHTYRYTHWHRRGELNQANNKFLSSLLMIEMHTQWNSIQMYPFSIASDRNMISIGFKQITVETTQRVREWKGNGKGEGTNRRINIDIVDKIMATKSK